MNDNDLRQKDLRQIRDQISAIERKLGTLEKRVDSFITPVPWYRRLYHWANDRPAAAVIVAIVLCLVSIVCGAYLNHDLEHKDDALNARIDARLDVKLVPLNQRLEGIDTKLTGLQSTLDTLKPYIQDLVQKEMTRASALKVPQLKQELPMIAHALTTARAQGIPLQAESINHVSSQLAGIEQTSPPAFWQAASALINYRTAKLNQPVLPDCATQTPTLLVTTPAPVPVPLVNYGEGLEYKDCTIVLDHAEGIVASHLWKVEHDSMKRDHRSNQLFTLVLDRVHVIYRGGQILPADKITFQFCTFEYDVNSVPPPRARTLTKTLLVSGDQSTLTLGPDASKRTT